MHVMTVLIKSATLVLLVATYGFAQSTQTTESANSKSGAITGRVVNEHGEPLADAVVTVRTFALTEPPQNLVTDREGRFRATGLSSAVYLASAFLVAYTPVPRDPNSTQPTSYRVGDDINIVLIKGGVISGTVTTSNGNPVVGVRVRVQMIRDGNGQPSRYGASTRDRGTDDRGKYRIYGLPSGTYLVFTGGVSSSDGPYDNDAPTYSPSSVRDTAAEISVRAGEETGDVDIRYRGDSGRFVSGNVIGPVTPEPYGSSVMLTSTLDGGSQLNESVYVLPGVRGFIINGVADGDYYVTAQSFLPGGSHISEPKRITVRGADVTNLELTTKPLASISGRVVLEESKAEECKGKKKAVITETLISAWHNEKESKDRPQFVWSLGGPVYPNAQGDVTLRNLVAGQYQIIARQFAKYWYLRSITLPAPPGTATKPNQPNGAPGNRGDRVLNWTTVRSGERLTGLVVTVAEGAASVLGQVTTEEESSIPEKMYVYLVPAERESEQDLMRYFATPIAADKTIAFNNVPPGRYLVAVQPALDNFRPTLTKLRLPDEGETRARLRRASLKGELELKPCQNLLDYKVPFRQAKP
jgi:hypothetical protein